MRSDLMTVSQAACMPRSANEFDISGVDLVVTCIRLNKKEKRYTNVWIYKCLAGDEKLTDLVACMRHGAKYIGDVHQL